MKFHRVRLENLNSLYGEQIIDFEDDVRHAPIFLIVGPTGAGKSTILDAVCLALFGQTPRLDRKTGRPETDVAHIMSIGTGSSAAEVEFTVRDQSGQPARYLATWTCRRAYNDPEGAVQRPERGLYRIDDTGNMRLVVSDSREKYFQPHFDEALHCLTVEDFKRSILLAQGQFSAFLHADDQEKASILERLTDTEEYRRIGERAAQRRRKIERRHQKLEQRLADTQLLKHEERKALRNAIDEGAKELSKLRDAHDVARAALEWTRTRIKLEEEAEAADQRLCDVRTQRDELEDEFEKLRRDERVQPAEAAYRAVVELEAKIAQTRDSLPELEEKIDAAHEQSEQARERLSQADLELSAARKELKDAEPTLQRAVELRARLDSARRELEQANEKAERAGDAVNHHDEAIEEAKARLEASQKLLDEARTRDVDLGEAHVLLERLEPLRAHFTQGILPLLERREKVALEAAERQKSLGELGEQRRELDAQLAEHTRSRGSAQAVVTRMRNKLEALVGDGDVDALIESLNGELTRTTRKRNALREATYILDKIRKSEKERDELHERANALEDEVVELEEQQSSLKELEATQRELARKCEESIRQNERLLALSSYRRELQSGDPCPLCGSPVHPYCESDELAKIDAEATRDRERLESELAQAREALKATNEKVQYLSSRYVSRKTALRHEESRYIALKETLEEDQRAFARSAEEGGFPPLEVFRLKQSDELALALDAARTRVEELGERLESLHQARDQYRRAGQRLDEAEQAYREVANRASELDTRIEAGLERLSGYDKQLEEIDDELTEKADELLIELSSYGVRTDDLVGAPEVERALDRAEVLRDEVRRSRNALDKASQSVRTNEEALTRLQERREELTHAARAAQEALEARTKTVRELEAQTKEVFDGEEPEKVRERLENTIATREAAHAEAREALDAIASHLTALKTRKEAAAETLEKLQASLEKSQTTLHEVLAELELTREEVARDLLSVETRRQLRQRVKEVEDALTTAGARLKDAKERLAAHLEEVPPVREDEVETESRELEVLERRAAELDDRVNQATLELGALRERWARNEEAVKRHEELQGQLQELERELDTWNTIYQLIGVREGERFQQFAQSLNLQGLVDRANQRLDQLYPRYQLAVARGEEGEPTLSFAVVDRYQANSERPLTTLSGGETFLVSLALALSLADYRQVEMPIETLLLDEGFGTLDQDSLHLALSTLHQLHQDGSRQIGIISHVEALKELVDTRIVVEKRGHGRSRVRFEFGHSPDRSPSREFETLT